MVAPSVPFASTSAPSLRPKAVLASAALFLSSCGAIAIVAMAWGIVPAVVMGFILMRCGCLRFLWLLLDALFGPYTRSVMYRDALRRADTMAYPNTAKTLSSGETPLQFTPSAPCRGGAATWRMPTVWSRSWAQN